MTTVAVTAILLWTFLVLPWFPTTFLTAEPIQENYPERPMTPIGTSYPHGKHVFKREYPKTNFTVVDLNAKHVDSKVTKVTVYNDRALVTRTSVVDLDAGEHTLCFDMLPSRMDKQSLQVTSATPHAMLKSVQFRQLPLEVDPESKRVELQRQIEDLNIQLTEVKDGISLLDEQRRLVQAMLDKVTSPHGKSETLSNDVDLTRWVQLLEFQKQTSGNLTGEIRKREREAKKLQSKIEFLSWQLQAITDVSGGRIPTRESVVIIVQNKRAGSLSLNLGYIVYDTHWQPTYDVRVSTEEKAVSITYHAVVTQLTGEDWKDVELDLSTAQPRYGGIQPELTPWRLSERTNVRFFAESMRMKGPVSHLASISLRSAAGSAMQNQFEGVSADADAAPPPPATPMAWASADVSTRSTSVSFHIPGKHTVKSDNTEVKVMISQQQYPATFRYSTVPKLAERTYLKAKLTNTADYPLLAGSANVFVDSSYVTSTQLRTVAPGEECWVFLGTDEGIVVKYKFVKRHESTEGWLLSTHERRRVVFEYQIEVQNTKKTTEQVVVWDQIPISQDKQITVELLEPKYTQDTESLRKTDMNYLEWLYTLTSGEKVTLPLRFAVEYPKGMTMDGL